MQIEAGARCATVGRSTLDRYRVARGRSTIAVALVSRVCIGVKAQKK
jgi:hypothetical protein